MNDQVGPDPDEEVKQHSIPSDPVVISEIQDDLMMEDEEEKAPNHTQNSISGLLEESQPPTLSQEI